MGVLSGCLKGEGVVFFSVSGFRFFRLLAVMLLGWAVLEFLVFGFSGGGGIKYLERRVGSVRCLVHALDRRVADVGRFGNLDGAIPCWLGNLLLVYPVLGSKFEKEVFELFCAAFAREEGARNLDCVLGMRWKKRGVVRDFRCAWLCGF